MLTTLLTSVGLPILLDLVKSAAPALSRKFLGVSVDEQVKLEQSSVSKLEALAKLDNPYGTPSQWVIDIRGVFRYAYCTLLLLVGGGLAIYGASSNDMELITGGLELAATPGMFILGERLVLSFKGGPK